MVNLSGLLPVLGGWGSAMSVMTDVEKKAEHSLMLYLRPDLVAPDMKTARSISGANYAEAFATAQRDGWPGYLGAPQYATAALAKRIWTSFSAAAVKAAVEILDGKHPSTYPRYLACLKTLPRYRDLIATSNGA